MSSFKNAQKSNQKQHRERSQLSSRKHLGLLEKKKDYKQRADDYQKKRNTLKALKRKALDRNPDEFYFKMVRTRLEDGVHQREEKKVEHTEEQLKLMNSQDLNYVNYKRGIELKKIERLKSGLHLLDSQDKPKNKHIVFLDSKKAVKEFDAAKHLDTHPALLGRTFNRPKLESLQKDGFQGSCDDKTLATLAAERSKQYRELGKRIDREKQLHLISQKLEMKNNLLDKKSKKIKVSDETPKAAAQYKWQPKRKR